MSDIHYVITFLYKRDKIDSLSYKTITTELRQQTGISNYHNFLTLLVYPLFSSSVLVFLYIIECPITIPRPRLDLEPYKAEIHARIYDRDETINNIVKWLKYAAETLISRSTVLRRCKEQGFQQRAAPTTPELVELIRLSFFSS